MSDKADEGVDWARRVGEWATAAESIIEDLRRENAQLRETLDGFRARRAQVVRTPSDDEPWVDPLGTPEAWEAWHNPPCPNEEHEIRGTSICVTGIHPEVADWRDEALAAYDAVGRQLREADPELWDGHQALMRSVERPEAFVDLVDHPRRMVDPRTGVEHDEDQPHPLGGHSCERGGCYVAVDHA